MRLSEFWEPVDILRSSCREKKSGMNEKNNRIFIISMDDYRVQIRMLGLIIVLIGFAYLIGYHFGFTGVQCKVISP